MNEDKSDYPSGLYALMRENLKNERYKYSLFRLISAILSILFLIAVTVSVCVYSSALRYQADRQLEASRYQTDALIEHLENLVIETVSTEVLVDGGDGGNAVYGNNNTVAGGDVNG